MLIILGLLVCCAVTYTVRHALKHSVRRVIALVATVCAVSLSTTFLFFLVVLIKADHSQAPIWYAGPDLAASKLKTKHPRKIIQAFKLIPRGVQDAMRTTSIGTRTIDPARDDFFCTIIEERKTLPKKHPHYLLLKIIANSLYGIFAELNKYEYGKNKAKQLEVFSGEQKFEQSTCVVERPGKWQFPPAAALITAGGRLMLSILEHMVEEHRGAYLLTDTDSMLFVASKNSTLVPCPGGQHKLPDGRPAVKAMTWKQVEEICTKLNRLNPYRTVAEILKIEECNYDRAGKPHQLYGLAVSAKRYVVYTRSKSSFEIIKPSEDGLGIVYVPENASATNPWIAKIGKLIIRVGLWKRGSSFS